MSTTNQTDLIEETIQPSTVPPLEHTHDNNYNLLGPIWITIHDRTLYLFPNGIGFKLAIFPNPLKDTAPLYETNINFGQAGEIDQPPLIPNNAGAMNTPYTLPIPSPAQQQSNNSTITIVTGPLITQLQLSNFQSVMQAYQQLIAVLQHYASLTTQEPDRAAPTSHRATN